MSENNPAAEALQIARAKVSSLLEIYAPLHSARQNALDAMGAAMVEFEAAVRADERAAVQAKLDAKTIDDSAERTEQQPPAPVEPTPLDLSTIPPAPPAEPTGDGMPALAATTLTPSATSVVDVAAPLQAAPVVDPATVGPATTEPKKNTRKK
jgi:hypothetical protein